MSVEAWLPILTAILAAIGGAIVYSVQKRADRKSDLIAKKRLAYEGYLFSYLKASTDFGTGSCETKLDLNTSRMTVLLIGSDAVIRAVAALDKYSVQTSAETGQQRDPRKFKALFSEVVLAMRSDVFEATGLSLDEMKAALPISDA